MSDVLDRPITNAFLEELFEQSIPCGGVRALRIPPCGAEAVVALDRHHQEHCVHSPVSPADFKCRQCYELWRAPLEMAVRAGLGLHCGVCGYVAVTVDAFARYVAL